MDGTTQKRETQTDDLKFDCRLAEFPSDALSVKRLRKIFPQHFDQPDTLHENFTSNDFFFPADVESPDHLVKLTDLICYERAVAAGAFFQALSNKDAGYTLNEEEQELIDRDKISLLDHYQFFKLADSPETARLLIRQCEEQGEHQAKAVQEKSVVR